MPLAFRKRDGLVEGLHGLERDAPAPSRVLRHFCEIPACLAVQLCKLSVRPVSEPDGLILPAGDGPDADRVGNYQRGTDVTHRWGAHAALTSHIHQTGSWRKGESSADSAAATVFFSIDTCIASAVQFHESGWSSLAQSSHRAPSCFHGDGRNHHHCPRRLRRTKTPARCTCDVQSEASSVRPQASHSSASRSQAVILLQPEVDVGPLLSAPQPSHKPHFVCGSIFVV